MIFENMDRIVFAGDSITDMDRERPVGEGLFESLGHGYVRAVENMLSAFYPERMLRVTNMGCNGNTSRDLFKRFENEILPLHPDWLVICIGVNDVWRQFDSPAMPDTHVDLAEYESNVEKMIVSGMNNSKGVIVMSPYYMEPCREDPMRRRMDKYGAVCRKLAEKHGCRFVDLQAMFDYYFHFRHSSYIAWDRVHPNQIGATLIARELLTCCGFDYFHKAETEEGN